MAVSVVKFFGPNVAVNDFFYIQSKKLQYILLNYTTYKILYPTTSTIPLEQKTMTT